MPIATEQHSSGAHKAHLRRNLTSFPAEVTAKLTALYKDYQRLRTDGDSGIAHLLKFYQYLVREYMTNPEFGVGEPGNSRGLLVYHSTGLGKTITAISCALALMDRFSVVAILPRALYGNLANSIDQVIRLTHAGATEDEIAKLQADAKAKFSYVSFDAYNMAQQVSRIGLPKGASRDLSSMATLDDKLLIVDEAHNFFRAIINSANENTNARKLYTMIQNAKGLRILFLTATPSSKHPFEMVACMNLLAGADILPTSFDTFSRLYIDRAARKIKNRGKLANRILGMVSHVSPQLPVSVPGEGAGANFVARADGGLPEQLPTKVKRTEMSPEQYRVYLLARGKEDAEAKGAGSGTGPAVERISQLALALPGAERRSMKSYFVHSRSLSNFAPPREFVGQTVEAMPDSAFTAETSPKAADIVGEVEASPGSSLIYSQFVDIGGLRPVERFLRAAGYSRYTPGADLPPAKRYAVITGDVTGEDRQIIQDAFNQKANNRGALIRVLLVSKPGAEGLSLRCIRTVIVLESYWDFSRILQVFGRAVRIGSHDDLPPEDRDVQPIIYVGIANQATWIEMPPESREAKAIDEQFFEKAEERHELNKDMQKILRSVSLECTLFRYADVPGEECRLCLPTSAPLFSRVDNYDQDIKLPDPCETYTARDVAATPIELDGVTYYYARDDAGDHFYESSAELGGYVPVDPSDPVIAKLRAVVAKKKA